MDPSRSQGAIIPPSAKEEIAMDTFALIRYCLSKPGAREDHPFGPETTVIKVASRMFALISDGAPPRISLKCDPAIAENLREQHACVIPGYHLNKTHWNTVIVDGSLPPDDLFAMIDHSYELVVRRLTRAERAAAMD
jgi:predicted DNA-binding protein (MmcQ/YjbR family)